MMHWDGYGTIFVLFLPKMHNLILIMRKHQTQREETLYKIILNVLQKCQLMKTKVLKKPYTSQHSDSNFSRILTDQYQ